MSNIPIRQFSIKMGLSQHSILQGWLKNEDKIYSENINQSARRIGSGRTPEILPRENELKEWIINRQKEGKPASKKCIQLSSSIWCILF